MDKQYTVIGVHKVKASNNVIERLRHNLREKVVLNADPKAKNYEIPEIKEYQRATVKDAMSKYRIRMEGVKKPRKDSVEALEYVLSASQPFFLESRLPPPKDGSKKRRKPIITKWNLKPWEFKAWVKANVKFIEDKHGKENIIDIRIHLDETTPHIQAIVIPEYQGKLNAKHFTGGKKVLAALHTEYNQAMKLAGFQLFRGRKETKGEHQKIADYRHLVNEHEEAREKRMQPILERVSKNGKVSAEEVKDIVDYGLIMKDQRDQNMATAESEINNLKDKVMKAEKFLDNERKRGEEYMETGKIKALDALRAKKSKQGHAPVKIDTHPLPTQKYTDEDNKNTRGSKQ